MIQLQRGVRLNEADALKTSASRRRKVQPPTEEKTAIADTILQGLASGAAALIPCSIFFISHFEIAHLSELDWRHWETAYIHVVLSIVVVVGLCYSAPTVASWAKSWTGETREDFGVKAWSFTVLLEFVQTFGAAPGLPNEVHVLPWICLGFLAGINLLVAYVKSGQRRYKLTR
jgi:hypothetical protein